MKVLKCEFFDNASDLIDFVNDNKIFRKDINSINSTRGGQYLYFWDNEII